MSSGIVNSEEMNLDEIGRRLGIGENLIDNAVVFILLWVASCDGAPQAAELEFIRSKLSVSDQAVDLERLQAWVRDQQQDIFESLFLVVRGMPENEQNFLFELAVGVALIDGDLELAEYHALEFLADLIGGGILKFKVVHSVVSGKELPQIGDPSSMAWWRAKDGNYDQQDAKTGSGSRDNLNKNEALKLLDLSEGATDLEIKKAYKRKLQAYHPDRFEALGSEAKKTAKQAFLKVRDAYEVLRP